MKCKARVYIYIPGIKSDPGSADGWTDKAVTWTHTHNCQAGYRGEKYEYMAWTITRRIHQQQRAISLAKMISFYDPKEWDVILVGHSNGADVALRTLHLLGGRTVHAVHLIAPACEADMEKSGLLDMLATKTIENLYVYVAGMDKAMKSARRSQRWFGWLGLGYGDLGGQKPEDVGAIIGTHNVIFEPNYGHSTWFDDENFNITMKFIMARK